MIVLSVLVRIPVGKLALQDVRKYAARRLRVFLTLLKVGGQQILTLSQAPNSKPNDVNHTEPEFFLQALNEMKVGVRETNGRGLEFLVLHELKFCNWTIGLSLLKINRECGETSDRYLRDIALRRISVSVHHNHKGCV